MANQLPTDQYGVIIPSDLVLMPRYQDLTTSAIDVIDQADWYECNKRLLISQESLPPGIEGDDPSDAGIDVMYDQIYAVDAVLHRHNVVDGWYHA